MDSRGSDTDNMSEEEKSVPHLYAIQAMLAVPWHPCGDKIEPLMAAVIWMTRNVMVLLTIRIVDHQYFYRTEPLPKIQTSL